jgi:hypothetical protein
LGLPEKHGYDLDFVLLAYRLRQHEGIASPVPLIVCEDRPDVLDRFRDVLDQLPDPEMAQHVELVQVDTLTEGLPERHFDWAISTASVQRLADEQMDAYLQNARQMADYAFLFVPNSGNRAHLTLSGLRGFGLDEVLAWCQGFSRASAGGRRTPLLLAAGYCDIPPFPPGLQRSKEAKEQAMHSPLETLAMWCLQWWCRGESWMPFAIQKRWAHLVYVALDLGGGAL